MLLFFIVLVIIILFIIGIFFLKLILHIYTLEIHWKNGKLQYNIEARLSLYIMNKVPIFSIKINNKRINKILKKHKKINIHNMVTSNNKFLQLKYFQFQIYNINLKLVIDTEDICVTAFLVGFISALIPIILHNNIVFDSNEDTINIQPMYNMNNSVDLFLKCKLNIKLNIKTILKPFAYWQV